MKFGSIAGALIIGLFSVSAISVRADTLLRDAPSFALKSGESVEVGDLYYVNVANCRSLLTSPPEVTVMDGPPGVTASVTEAMVVPRQYRCSSPVKGAKLRLSADKIEEQSYSQITLRIKYKTKDGETERSNTYNITLFP